MQTGNVIFASSSLCRARGPWLLLEEKWKWLVLRWGRQNHPSESVRAEKWNYIFNCVRAFKIPDNVDFLEINRRHLDSTNHSAPVLEPCHVKESSAIFPDHSKCPKHVLSTFFSSLSMEKMFTVCETWQMHQAVHWVTTASHTCANTCTHQNLKLHFHLLVTGLICA